MWKTYDIRIPLLLRDQGSLELLLRHHSRRRAHRGRSAAERVPRAQRHRRRRRRPGRRGRRGHAAGEVLEDATEDGLRAGAGQTGPLLQQSLTQTAMLLLLGLRGRAGGLLLVGAEAGAERGGLCALLVLLLQASHALGRVGGFPLLEVLCLEGVDREHLYGCCVCVYGGREVLRLVIVVSCAVAKDVSICSRPDVGWPSRESKCRLSSSPDDGNAGRAVTRNY